MASEGKVQPVDPQARRQQIEAEWARAGQCAGMHLTRGAHRAMPGVPVIPEAKQDNWQPNRRCCP